MRYHPDGMNDDVERIQVTEQISLHYILSTTEESTCTLTDAHAQINCAVV